MYFRFCGWRYFFHIMELTGQNKKRRVFCVEFARRRHGVGEITVYDCRLVTGPPTQCRWARLVTVAGVWRRRRRLSSSVTRRICNVTHQGAARDGGPAVLRSVRATPCLIWFDLFISYSSPRQPRRIVMAQHATRRLCEVATTGIQTPSIQTLRYTRRPT